MTDPIEELKRALAESTGGEWKAVPDTLRLDVFCVVVPGSIGALCETYEEPDARFIALAHNHLPELLAQLTEARAECERLRERANNEEVRQTCPRCGYRESRCQCVPEEW